MATDRPIFTKIVRLNMPDKLLADAAGNNTSFDIQFSANGVIAFPQVLFRFGNDREFILTADDITLESNSRGTFTYVAHVPAGKIRTGTVSMQVEGCRRPDIKNASASDWIKIERQFRIERQLKIGKGIEPLGIQDDTTERGQVMSPTEEQHIQPPDQENPASQKLEASPSAQRRRIPEENLVDDDPEFFKNSLKIFMREPFE